MTNKYQQWTLRAEADDRLLFIADSMGINRGFLSEVTGVDDYAGVVIKTATLGNGRGAVILSTKLAEMEITLTANFEGTWDDIRDTFFLPIENAGLDRLNVLVRKRVIDADDLSTQPIYQWRGKISSYTMVEVGYQCFDITVNIVCPTPKPAEI